MKKISLIFYCITFVLICQPVAICGAVTDVQKNAIIEHCDKIKDSLKNTQKVDAKARIYLGGYYETILSKFITPLNVRLVENNLSTAGLVENQNSFAEARALFANDFIKYQQGLEELVAMDCKADADGFYNKLVNVRQRRKTVEQDVLKIRSLVSENVKLVDGLKAKL